MGRTVELPRALTDQERNRLVIDLRETFDAKGKIRDEGAFKQWTNSNLQALLEPTETGQRLRLRTVKGDARSFQGMGAAFMTGPVGAGIASMVFAVDPVIRCDGCRVLPFKQAHRAALGAKTFAAVRGDHRSPDPPDGHGGDRVGGSAPHLAGHPTPVRAR